MSNIFFIADTHFNEPEVMFMARENNCFCPSCDAKDNILIKNWNKVVKPDDRVFILGDFGEPSYAKDLNGIKILIKGNHDNYDEEKGKRLAIARCAAKIAKKRKAAALEDDDEMD